jgi:NTP pyrophosphatase (non-canonical NTP hydrolase)
MIEYIREQLPHEELLCQLAEEAAELSQAALKLRRVYDGSNPTPVSLIDALESVHEEIADVRLCLRVLGYELDTQTAQTMMDAKLERWARRLKATRLEI